MLIDTPDKNRQEVLIRVKEEVKQMMELGYIDVIIIQTFLDRGVDIQTTKDFMNEIRQSVINSVAPVHTETPIQADLSMNIGFTKDQSSFNGPIIPVQHTEENTTITHAPVPVAEGSESLSEEFTPGYPTPALNGLLTEIRLSDRVVKAKSIAKDPEVVVFENLLTPQECDEIIKMSETKITASEVVDNDTGKNYSSDYRTSSGVMYSKGSTDLLRKLEEITAQVCNWPYENSEGFQVLHYKPGQQYKPHFDYFHEDSAGAVNVIGRAGNRVGTLLIYLNDVQEGGGTDFNKRGITVQPKKGSAVFFSFHDKQNRELSMHAGLPPVSGDKWVAVNWLRQGAYSR